jgi:hypothetical protein
MIFPKNISQKMTEFVQEKNTGTIPTLALAYIVFLWCICNTHWHGDREKQWERDSMFKSPNTKLVI